MRLVIFIVVAELADAQRQLACLARQNTEQRLQNTQLAVQVLLEGGKKK
jgi:hypothetical protein